MGPTPPPTGERNAVAERAASWKQRGPRLVFECVILVTVQRRLLRVDLLDSTIMSLYRALFREPIHCLEPGDQAHNLRDIVHARWS